MFNQFKIHELQDKLQALTSQSLTWANEMEALRSDFRMRELQLKNINKVSKLNKALKEEVRKLHRSGSASSSVVGSPIMSRPETAYKSISQSVSISNLEQPGPSRSSSSSRLAPHQLPDPDPQYLKNVVLKFLESTQKVF